MGFLVFLIGSLFGCPLSELGHDEFERRSAASDGLRRSGPLGIPLAWAGLNSGDPEVIHRCHIYLKKYPVVVKAHAHATIDYSAFFAVRPAKKAKANFNLDQWDAFVRTAILLDLHDPKRELLLFQYQDGIVWTMYARSKARQLGYDWKNHKHDKYVYQILRGEVVPRFKDLPPEPEEEDPDD